MFAATMGKLGELREHAGPFLGMAKAGWEGLKERVGKHRFLLYTVAAVLLTVLATLAVPLATAWMVGLSLAVPVLFYRAIAWFLGWCGRAFMVPVCFALGKTREELSAGLKNATRRLGYAVGTVALLACILAAWQMYGDQIVAWVNSIEMPKPAAQQAPASPGQAKLQEFMGGLLKLMRLLGLVALIISMAMGAVMVGLREPNGLQFVIWSLLGGVIFFGTATILTWLGGAQ